MFYYPDVLQRHTGCFSTIWLAATRGIMVTRREYLKVNVQKTCEDIVDYVTARVPPPQPGLPRPRFSLYLSSQLQYGVVLVFNKQCCFLLEEAQQTIECLLRFNSGPRIDMVVCDRLALDLPDALCMKIESEGAQDPFFGVMESHQLPSPYKIQQQHIAAKAAITMAEESQSPNIPESFQDADLPEITSRELDLLIEESDQFFGDSEGQQNSKTPDIESDQAATFDQLLKKLLGPELPDKEAGQHTAAPLDALDLEVTPANVDFPSPPSRESENEVTVTPPPHKPRRGRGRQLVFIDLEVQLSDETMKEHIGNPLVETQPMSKVMLDLTAMKHATPAQLFAAPCGPLLSADLLSAWKQSFALPTEVRDTLGVLKRRVTSEPDRDDLRERRHHSRTEMSGESGLQLSEASSLGLTSDRSREHRSTGDSIAPLSSWSPPGELKHFSAGPIVENNGMPEAAAEPDINDLCSGISADLQAFGQVIFDSLLPPMANRGDAAHTMHQLLELLSAGEVSAKQTQPYATITINAESIRKTI